MAGGLPPPPTRAASGDFAWTAWYNQLYTLLSTSGSVSWSLVNKAGSSIADLVTRSHNLLTGFQGGTTNEYYHLTAAQHSSLGAGNHNDLLSKQGGTTNEYYHLSASDYNKVHTPVYGGFYSNVSQTVTAANTATALTFNGTEYSNSVSIGTPTSRIVIATAGLYVIDVDMQFSKANASTSIVDFWFRRNGTDITNSASTVTLSGNNVRVSTAHTLLEEVAVNDYFEIMMSSPDSQMQVTATGTQTSPTRPAAPSVLLTVTRM